MSEEEESAANLPDRDTCQKLVEEFASLTNTDEALAQFFLQDHNWNLEPSLNAFFESQGEQPQSRQSDPDLILTFDSAVGNRLGLMGDVTVRPPNQFKLLTWNLDGLDDHNLKKRTKAVAKVIEIEQPDVIFLQELVPVTFSYLEDHLPHYTFIGGGADGYFIATLLRRTTVYFDAHVLHQFPQTRMGRNLLLVECHVGSLKLRLLNTHLESTQDGATERKAQLRASLDLLKGGGKEHTSIFGGDLNLRDKEAIEVSIPSDVFDLWESCGQRQECRYTWDTLRNTNKSFPGRFKPRSRFDRVYLHQSAPPSVQPDHFGLVGIQKVSGTQSFPSDHWGILVHFDILNQRAHTSSPPPSHSSIQSPTVTSGTALANRTIDVFDVSDDASFHAAETLAAPVIEEAEDARIIDLPPHPTPKSKSPALVELD